MPRTAAPVRRSTRGERKRATRRALVYAEPEKAKRKVARKAYKEVKHREKEPGFISSGGKILGGALGSLFGPAGTGIGSFLGGKLGHLVETVTGFGDYTIHQNSVMAGGMSPPQIVNSINDGGVIIRHREFIADIPSTSAFTVQSFLIQPGISDCFPWLSQIANSFEQYKLRGMIFEFKSTSSDAVLSTSTSSSLGSVSMMTDYDVADPVPTTKRQMLNAEFSSSNKPSCSFIHPIECKRTQTPVDMLYTRGSLVIPPGFDQRLYDFARFNIATEGMQGVVGNVGELWVTYEIELFKPQYDFYGFADHFRGTLITNLLPLGVSSESVNAASGGTLGGQTLVDGRTYLFPPNVSSGTFMIGIYWGGGGVPLLVPPTYVLTNCVLVNMLQNDNLGSEYSPNPGPTNNTIAATNLIIVRLTGQNAKIVFDTNGTLPGVTNWMDLFVVRLPDKMGPVPT